MPIELQEYIAGQIWLCRYPVRYLCMKLYARMTVIRLDDGRLMLHSPCEIDDHMCRALAELDVDRPPHDRHAPEQNQV